MINLLDEVWSNFGELPIKHKVGLRLFMFSTSGLGHIIFAALPILCIAGFKGREKWICLYQTENIYPSKLSWLRIWCPSRKFGNEMNLKGLLYLALLNRLKAEVNFFIRELFEVFYFLSDFTVVAEHFKRDFWEFSVLGKCFKSLWIRPKFICMFYGWQ